MRAFEYLGKVLKESDDAVEAEPRHGWEYKLVSEHPHATLVGAGWVTKNGGITYRNPDFKGTLEVMKMPGGKYLTKYIKTESN